MANGMDGYLIREIIIQIYKAKENIKAIQAATEPEIIKQKTIIEQLQDKCKHPITYYEHDASGNNDSTTTCIICEKVID